MARGAAEAALGAAADDEMAGSSAEDASTAVGATGRLAWASGVPVEVAEGPRGSSGGVTAALGSGESAGGSAASSSTAPEEHHHHHHQYE